MAIGTVVRSIQDIMWKDSGVDGDAQRISQLVWMLFLKIFDDKEKEWELFDSNYVSPIPSELRWRSWAVDDSGMTGDELIDFVNNKLFKGLKELEFTEYDDPKGYIVKQIFEDAYNYMKSGTLMRQIINKIDNEIDFTRKEDTHVFNDIYENILKSLQSAGNAGEFYTPRTITKFMVEMIAPKLGEKVLDPACGTGGFLGDTVNHIREHYVKTPDDEQVLQESISGIEWKPLPHMLCTTNMILHGFEVPKRIRRDNALSRPLRDYTNKDRVDVIFSNPPFGGITEDGIQAGFPKDFQTKETAQLFLVLIMELLKDGGRSAVVVPDGFLFGEGVGTRVKTELLATCNLHTIVRLPNGVFAPYTSISTNLLFFEKGKPTEEIWYYEVPLPKGLTNSYTKTRQFSFSELLPIKLWWNNREENECAWKVTIDEIKSKNYNLDIKNQSDQSESSELEIDEVIMEMHKNVQSVSMVFSQLQEEISTEITSRNLNEAHVEVHRSLLTEINLLKSAILRSAIRGRLVAQDHNDEPACELLKKITEEKDSSKITKKSKKVIPVSSNQSQEIPFEIPKSWEWIKLDGITIADFGGGTPSKQIPDYWKEEIPWASVKDISDTQVYLNETRDMISAKGLSNSTSNLIEPGAFIAVTRMGLGRSVINNIPVAINQDLRALRISKFFDIKLLWYFYKTFVFKHRGMTVSGVRREELLGMAIPIPPFAEQQRIVKKIDSLFSLLDLLITNLM